ncbi:MAG: hypothetical protein A2751_03100 [Candidatus Doudnabacteria bacterium RIFCSPHIGHO2_01_FULL_46_14]|uniref:NAD-dependent epimerase/dehydratase domain-containing protein n=1 Tax=Candidatus Doudnabacteria bacterium RIFCSPHIGHO2_01_FULL_46_14 TaxID=1817824 RepID=A0A1F5NKR6_9BACT|nr:MAG: hypothetical protein A2751_03100 [Candidatus Doudnabacteria bacterium RIFCSPHIGHO2_01_FULL_46_14]
MAEKVFITGASGFIGANLMRRLLADGFEVTAAIRPGSKNFWRLEDVTDQIRILRLDLTDQKDTAEKLGQIGPNYIFHLAAYGAYPGQIDSEQMWRTNLFAAINLIEAAKVVGFQKMIIAGSSSEYGKKSEAMKESDRLEPSTIYGVSKAASTLYCQYRAREEKLPLAILRPFSVYGPWEEPGRLAPRLIGRALKNEPLELVGSKTVRDFIYIDDVVEACLKSMNEDKINGQIMNICSGMQTEIGEMAEQVVSITGSKSRVQRGSYEARSFDTDIWVGNPEKTKKLLGWQARVALKEGIRQTVEWYKSHKHYYEH